MNWSFWLIGFALAVFMGSALVSLFATIRPQWSARRRRLTAASILPAITAIATFMGVLIVWSSEHGDQMKDLAIAALAMLGGGFTLLAWIGSLVGATLTSRRQIR